LAYVVFGQSVTQLLEIFYLKYPPGQAVTQTLSYISLNSSDWRQS